MTRARESLAIYLAARRAPRSAVYGRMLENRMEDDDSLAVLLGFRAECSRRLDVAR